MYCGKFLLLGIFQVGNWKSSGLNSGSGSISDLDVVWKLATEHHLVSVTNLKALGGKIVLFIVKIFQRTKTIFCMLTCCHMNLSNLLVNENIPF